MDISHHQLETIQRWAQDEPLIAAVHLFGSRARGTSRPDSDTDLALELVVEPHMQREVFFAHGSDWQAALRNLTGLLVNIDWMNKATTAAVSRDGVELYRRSLV